MTRLRPDLDPPHLMVTRTCPVNVVVIVVRDTNINKYI